MYSAKRIAQTPRSTAPGLPEMSDARNLARVDTTTETTGPAGRGDERPSTR